jgi:hypothetical protein
MDTTVPENQWLDRAFKLACFIHRDRATAVQIAMAAMSKLEVASAAQDKRLYYTPTGRSSARKSRNKVLLGEAHLLQRLVYVESEVYERQNEERGLSGEEEMIIHFIKHLVRITIKRNSFYVNLGLSRLLHNYTTSETQDIYNVIVQDADRVRDDYYYRSRKAQLMRELKERFGDLLKVCRGQRGEERFHCQERLDDHASLVEKCLKLFTPWNTPCLMAAGFDPFNDVVSMFSFRGDEPDMEHEVEINRIHAVLDPECYGRVVGALSFDQPERRLEVPHFFLSGGVRNGGNGGGPRAGRDHLAELSGDEVLAISGALAEQAARRRAAAAGLLRVLVDGNEHAQLDLRRVANVRFPIAESAEVVEVRTGDGSADVLLAVHILALDEPSNGDRARKRSIVLEGGQELSFYVTRSNDSVGEAVVDVAYRETSPVRAASLSLRRLGYRASDSFRVERWGGSSVLKPALALAFTILCAAMVVFYFQSRKSAPALEEAANQKLLEPGENSPPALSVNPPNVAENQNVVENQKVPGQAREQNKRAPGRVPNAAPPQVAKLVEAPPSENALAEDEATRALRVERIAASLSAVKRIYVESTGDESVRHEVRRALVSALQPGARFAIVTSLDDADAVLKTSVRREESKGKVLVIARLVNEGGEVLWPVTPRGSGEKYQGSAGAVSDRIVRDLLDTVRELESKRK